MAGLASIRAGGYICQCAAGNSVERKQREANERIRAKLTEQLANFGTQNSSFALDRLGLEADERLGEKSSVWNNFLRAPKGAAQNSTTKTIGYFELGARLETDSKLELLVQTLDGQSDDDVAKSSAWPEQTCRICSDRKWATKSDKKEPPDSAINDDSDASSPFDPSARLGGRPQTTTTTTTATWDDGLESTANKQLDSSDTGDADDCFDDSSFVSELKWIRPAVLSMQSICGLITILLVSALLRLRRSRVSSAKMRSFYLLACSSFVRFSRSFFRFL